VTVLQDKLKELQIAYSTIAQQVTTTQIAQAEAGSATNVSIGAAAARPDGPTGAHRHVYLGLAFLVALVASAGLAFLLEQLDHTVQSVADIRHAGGLPTLAVIPFVRRG
jgi:capsular polysaccharide biosynthesis protein